MARLATAGYIHVIITTNFDRLLEMALQQQGVAYHVISTASSLRRSILSVGLVAPNRDS